MKTFAAFLFRAAPVVAAGLLFTGCCAGGIPKPVSATKVEYGCRLKEADVAFIRSGVTTRTEVIARLGTNYTFLPQQRAIAYSWEMKGGGWIWWVFTIYPPFAVAEAGNTVGGWRVYFIAFDDHGVVRQAVFKSPSMSKSLHEHMYAWEKTRPPLVAPSSSPAAPVQMLAAKP